MNAQGREASTQHLDEVAARHPEKYEEYRLNDPAHIGHRGLSQDKEAKIALDMIEKRRWGEGTRRPGSVDQGDFVDEHGRMWDIKGYHSDYPDHVGPAGRLKPYRSAVTPERFTTEVHDLLEKDINVLLDSRNLDRPSIDFMSQIIREQGWAGRVEWYP